MKGPSPGAAKWRINEVGKKRRETGRERKKNHIASGKKRGSRNGVGRRKKEDMRMRKVDSEVYTVRRDLINPPELSPLKTSLRPLYAEGCAMFAGDFVLCSRAEQVSSNDLFRPMESPFPPFIVARVDISRVLSFASFAPLKSCRVTRNIYVALRPFVLVISTFNTAI